VFFSLRISRDETIPNFSDLKFGCQNLELMKIFLDSGTENPRVGSSILPLGTTNFLENADHCVGFFLSKIFAVPRSGLFPGGLTCCQIFPQFLILVIQLPTCMKISVQLNYNTFVLMDNNG
jgi:hypothetical protein